MIFPLTRRGQPGTRTTGIAEGAPEIVGQDDPRVRQHIRGPRRAPGGDGQPPTLTPAGNTCPGGRYSCICPPKRDRAQRAVRLEEAEVEVLLRTTRARSPRSAGSPPEDRVTGT